MRKSKSQNRPLTEEQKIRLIYSMSDFALANSAMIFLSDLESEKKYSKPELRRFRCYETTAIIAYVRPFSESRGKIPKLTLNLIGAALDHEKILLHNKLLRLRNKVFAHSDSDMMRFLSKPHKLEFENGFNFTILETVYDEGLTLSGLNDRIDLGELISAVSHAVVRRLFDEAQTNAHSFDMTKDYLDR
jgi:hypothetical protein